MYSGAEVPKCRSVAKVVVQNGYRGGGAEAVHRMWFSRGCGSEDVLQRMWGRGGGAEWVQRLCRFGGAE